eukprot:5134545-Amphidinium_carterae.1
MLVRSCSDSQEQVFQIVASFHFKSGPERHDCKFMCYLAQDKVQVQVRVPDGRRLRRNFRASDPVSQVYYFTNAEGRVHS